MTALLPLLLRCCIPHAAAAAAAPVAQGTLDCVLCRETGEADAQQALTVIDNNLKNPG
jgi:hypothetical protein